MHQSQEADTAEVGSGAGVDESEHGSSGVTESLNILQQFLQDEIECYISNGYSNKQRFIKMRPILIAYAVKYASALDNDADLVAAATIDYADIFLSKCTRIPVVIPGEGVKRHFQMFVLACASMACCDYGIFDLNSENEFMLQDKGADEISHVFEMREKIYRGLALTRRDEAVNACDLLDETFNLLTKDLEEDLLPDYLVLDILLAIKRDIKFTEFKHLTLVAAAILVTFKKMKPELYPGLKVKVFKRYGWFFDKTKVKECFKLMKEHVIVHQVLNFPGQASLFIGLPGTRKGKEPLFHHRSIDVVCEQFTEFDNDWLETPANPSRPRPRSRPRPIAPSPSSLHE